jgi:hypothetical protein
MSTNDGWGWYTSKICDMAGKKDEESWLYFLTKKTAITSVNMAARMVSTPVTICKDIGDIAVSVYNDQKAGVALGIITLASDIYSCGTAGAITRTIIEETPTVVETATIIINH